MVDQFRADLAALSANLTAGYEDNIQQCMQIKLERLDRFVENCVESGKGDHCEEELARLEQLAVTSYWIECFTSLAQSSCQQFVGEKVYEALHSTLLGLSLDKSDISSFPWLSVMNK